MWSKIDDKLHASQQARTAGLEAMGLWALGESYCGDQLTDGFIPAWWVIEKVGQRKGVTLADRLVRANLWERSVFGAEKGWNSVDFLDRNKSRKWVLDERAKTAKRQAEWRLRQQDDTQRNAVTNVVSHVVSNAVSNACPDQTRPDHQKIASSRSDETDENAAHAKRATSEFA